MFPRFLKCGSLAFALLLSGSSVQPLYAQHHGGGHHGGGGGGMGGGSHHGSGSYGGSSHHHHHSNGGNVYFGGGGISIGIGGGYPYGGYGNYGGYNSLRYSSGYGGSSYGSYDNSYPSYRSNVYVVPQYVNPPRTYVYQSPAPSVVYQSPSVQPSRVIIHQPQPSVQRSNLPGVTFGGRAHIPELASAVSERTNQLCLALHDSYLGNPQFNEVYRDTYLLITSAKQLGQVGGDPQAMLAIVSDMNLVFTSVKPAIESWRPMNGGSASASSHLSSVESALKLLSIDAGWDPSQSARGPAAVAPAPASREAPAPTGPELAPTPVDPVPAP